METDDIVHLLEVTWIGLELDAGGTMRLKRSQLPVAMRGVRYHAPLFCQRIP
jgi:hypothetical protein